ncbi:Tat pathway signal sequence domain protein [Streptomyces sp. SID8379]|uniref:BNR repeat-containing protein n=1 Tax=unclassified Streptomyces TaxID=2593676 RepID=UPI00035F027F|nr:MULTISPECIES: BNR repeat-containing protein [unclassified Streptomyces]MYW69695.1 Tat pathway signal sequence domain protein [Streptomyces sp. SID8379]
MPARRTVLLSALAATPLLGSASASASASAPAVANAAPPGPSVRLVSDSQLDSQALYFVSYDGLVNNNSFQKSGLLTYAGYQYAAWYTADRTAVLARRRLPGGPWQTLRLPHRLRYDDSHNVISLGASPRDGRLHVLMDSHSDAFFYVKSAAALLTRPADFPWSAAHFGDVQNTLDGVALTDRFTYPQFLATPEGKLQLLYRTGVSGNGQAALAEYDGTAWTDLGEWSSATGTYRGEHGSSTARSMYVHGFDYGPDRALHVFFTWREQNAAVMCSPGGLSNHEMAYVTSADRGRTWRDSGGAVVGVTGGADLVSVTDTGTVVEAIDPDHSLMNQESQAVDSAGRPHALWSYVPGRFGQCTTDYAADRVAHGRTFHMYRDEQGSWRKTEIPEPPASTQRSRLALDRHDNAYAIMPRAKIVAASAASGWTDWRVLYDGSGLDAYGEVLIDEPRLKADGVLSVLYQQASTGTTPSPIRVADFALPA